MLRTSFLLSALLSLGSCTDHEPSIPEFDAQGVKQELGALGRPVLLNLWAMWCAPCVKELPDFEAVGQEFRAAGGEAIGLCVEFTGSADQAVTRDRLPRFVARRKLSFPIWLYTESRDAPLFEGVALPRPRRGGIPITLAIDKNGKVVDFHEGQATREQLRALAKKARRGS